MDEIIDLLDENGNETNQTISKNEAHQRGLWHKAIHILIVNKDRTKTLIQQRSKTKNFYPNMWDIAVGGHVSQKEDYLTSSKRELQEELGLKPSDYELKEIGKTKEVLSNNNIISKEYINIYLLESDIETSEITLQKEEVINIKWVTKKELNELINTNKMIPHIKEYEILNEILI